MPNQQGPPIQCSVALKEKPTERLLFESFPKILKEGYSVRYRSNTVTAPTTSHTVYKGGAYNSFRLELKFVAGLHPDVNAALAGTTIGDLAISETKEVTDKEKMDVALEGMEAKVRWLEALCFPRPKRRRPSASKKWVVGGRPPRILITFGLFMTIDGTAENIEVSWGPKFHPVSARPFEVEVSLGIKRLHIFYPDWYDISQKAIKRSPTSYGTGATGALAKIPSVTSKIPRFVPAPIPRFEPAPIPGPD